MEKEVKYNMKEHSPFDHLVPALRKEWGLTAEPVDQVNGAVSKEPALVVREPSTNGHLPEGVEFPATAELSDPMREARLKEVVGY